MDINLSRPFIEILNAYFINLFVSVFICSMSMIVFYRLTSYLTNKIRISLILTTTLAFANLIFLFCTQLWGHPTALAFIIFSLYSIMKVSPINLFFLGFWVSMATMTDYLAVICVITFGLFCILKYRKKVLWYLLGGLLPMFGLLLYHYALAHYFPSQ